MQQIDNHILLKVKRKFPLNYPDLAARNPYRKPKNISMKWQKQIKMGFGFPKLINDDEVVPNLAIKGRSLKKKPMITAFPVAQNAVCQTEIPTQVQKRIH